MAKFFFKLQNILKLNEKIEEQKQLELGKENKILMQLKDELLYLNRQRDEHINDFYTENGKRLRALDLAKLNSSIKYYKDRIIEYEECIRVAHIKVEGKRQELRQALFEKKKYEVLKERAYERYLEEENQQEKRNDDEIINYKYRK